jgi:hypothetical protein
VETWVASSPFDPGKFAVWCQYLRLVCPGRLGTRVMIDDDDDDDNAGHLEYA